MTWDWTEQDLRHRIRPGMYSYRILSEWVRDNRPGEHISEAAANGAFRWSDLPGVLYMGFTTIRDYSHGPPHALMWEVARDLEVMGKYEHIVEPGPLFSCVSAFCDRNPSTCPDDFHKYENMTAGLLYCMDGHEPFTSNYRRLLGYVNGILPEPLAAPHLVQPTRPLPTSKLPQSVKLLTGAALGTAALAAVGYAARQHYDRKSTKAARRKN